MLQEKKGLETRNKNLCQELAAQHDHLEDLRSHQVNIITPLHRPYLPLSQLSLSKTLS